jgi:hypothetical protein
MPTPVALFAAALWLVEAALQIGGWQSRELAYALLAGAGLCTLWSIFHSAWLAALHRRYGQGYPVLSFIIAALIGAVVFGGGWILLGKLPSQHPEDLNAPARLQIIRVTAKNPGKFSTGETPFTSLLELRNTGDGTAKDIYFAHMIFLQDSRSLDTQKKAAASFQYQWPRFRDAIRTRSLLFTLRRNEARSFDIPGSIVNDQQRADILAGRLYFLLVAAVRYEDGNGTHELQLCRYLGAPFDGSNWIAGEVHEGTKGIREARIPVQVSYDFAGASLPLVVPPNSRLSILSFTDDKHVNLTWAQPSPVPMVWPPHRVTATAPSQTYSEQPVGIITFSNHSTSGVLNINTMLETHLKVAAPFGTEETIKALVGSPDIRPPSYLPLAIEFLGPGESIQIYVVNQSEYAAVIPLPAGGTLELPGETEKREITFRQRRNLPLDSSPPISGPSPYQWNNDQIVGRRKK